MRGVLSRQVRVFSELIVLPWRLEAKDSSLPRDSIVRVIYRKRERRAVLLWKFGLFLGLMLFTALVCYPKYRQVQELEVACAHLQSDLAGEALTNEELTLKKDRLEHDPEAIEQLARSLLELRRPGERVYRLIPEGDALVQKGGGETE